MATETYTREQISRLKGTKERLLFIIDNVVYDVTSFQDEHPGGHEVLFNEVGADASESFHDVGHSADAKELMHKYVVGELAAADRVEPKPRQVPWEDAGSDAQTGAEQSGFITSWKFPLLLGVLVTLLYGYLAG